MVHGSPLVLPNPAPGEPELPDQWRLYQLDTRVRTFSNWPFTEDCACTPEKVSLEEHRKHSPKCLFLTLKKSSEEMSVGEFVKLDMERAKIKMHKIMYKHIENFQTLAQTVRSSLEKLDKMEVETMDRGDSE
ncbi:PREDICTED: baculoviral IAP repeat-containing protein 5.2-like [Nanorana parkeri]|uniref:baculoviral IAP repeat-containing protein 5.2-like n=1 Tax=Nanorana parkeri TaxID=125878 RepID=UPI0008544041|nr:PREDICTED: baculoviral IAP repeat-containing protein 5.2-like [Nanorana parkeri]